MNSLFAVTNASPRAGLIWFEATAVGPEGKANPRQLLLNQENLSAFEELLRRVEQAAAAYDSAHRPVTVLQLTHSGRYSQEAVIATHEEALDAKLGLPPDYPLISDGELEALEDRFVEARYPVACHLRRQKGSTGTVGKKHRLRRKDPSHHAAL